MQNRVGGKKPVIGIVPAYDEGVKVPKMREGYLLRRVYTKVLASVGATPLILNVDMTIPEVVALCDGIVISGGEDIHPGYYGGRSLIHLEEPKTRTDWELQLLHACRKRHIPVLGICYGMQLLAVAFGGSLHQDIETEVPGAITHYDPKHNRSTKHKVGFVADFLGFRSGERPWVASRHHQAVSRLPEGFYPIAYASDGVLEAMQGDNCYGMQWHPESDETGIETYRSFVEHCSK